MIKKLSEVFVKLKHELQQFISALRCDFFHDVFSIHNIFFQQSNWMMIASESSHLNLAQREKSIF